MTRIEIHLTEDETKKLDTIAEQQGRSRKNLCETEIRKLIGGSAVKAVRQKSKK